MIQSLKDYIFNKKAQHYEDNDVSLEERMAFITHYMMNIGQAEENRFLLGKKYYNDMMGRNYDTPITPNDIRDFYGGIDLHFKQSGKPNFTFIDLFAGIGGFRLAMQSYGGRCVFSSEFNPNAQKTYSYNYGEVPFGDITKPETKHVIPEEFDILCGGFPCQAFSIAGYRKGFEDTRGTLFFDVADIIKEHKPKVAYLENVKNLQTHDGGKTFEVIKNTLEELGYYVFAKVLNACKYGNIPQNRERIIIVAFNKDKVPNYMDYKFPEIIELTKNIHDCINQEPQPEKYYYRESQIYYTRLVESMTSKDTIYQWRRIYARENKNNMCPTLTANMGGGGHNVPLILTDSGIRKLTPKECINFMGYPEDFSFPSSISESKMYMQAGNSVVVPMMTRVAESIWKIINTKN